MQNRPASAAAADRATEEEIQRILVQRVDVEKQSVGIIVGLVDATRPRFIAYGRRSATDPRVPDADALFNIGSITKMFTALLLMDAVHRGEMRMEDPVERHLPPSLKVPGYQGHRITLLDLVTHTSGLPVMPDDAPPESDQLGYARYGRDQLFAFLARYRLSAPPGSHWLYSNISAVLIAEALTYRARQPLPALLQTRVLKPLGLSSTFLSADTAPRERIIAGHDLDLKEVPLEPAPVLQGYGGMYSSARDLLQLVAAFLQLRLTSLGPAMRAMVQTHRPMVTYAGEQALGPQMFGKGEQLKIGHAGSTSGYASSLLWAPWRLGVVALSNAAPPVTDISFHILDPSSSLAAPMHSISVSRNVLERYVGRYNGGSGMVFVIALEEHGLTFENPGFAPKIDIVPESEGVFTVPRVGARITFEGPAPAPPVLIHVELAGTTYTGKRITN